MPAYDYRCSDCGIVREVRQKITDAPLTVCPECGGVVKRIIRSVGIIFKGSGFHVNDYRGASAARTEPPADEKSKDTAAPKSDTPATPPKPADSTEKPAGGGTKQAQPREQVA